MRRGFSAAGWILLALAVLVLAVTVSVGALQAHGTPEFNRWVGWATVAAVPLGAAGILLLLWAKITGSLVRPKMTGDNDEMVPGTPGRGGPARSGDTLPLRNPTFTGRAEALADLAQRLEVGPVAVVALRGLGGVGKSQLALEYAHRMRRAGRYRLAGWVRADSLVTIAEDIAALAPLVGLSTEGQATEVHAHVVAVLRTEPDWLLVFDNAQRPDDLVGMLPGGEGHVLVTSRNRVWSGIASQVDVGEFSMPESVEFLCGRSGRDDSEAAEELAQELGRLPLALAQAAAYIDTRSMTIRGYLESYRDPVLGRMLRDAGLDSAEYPASVARTWLLSFMHLSDEHPAVVELLRLCAFLDPDDIDLDLLSAGREKTGEILARVLGDKLERAEVAGILAATSLVAVPVEGHLRVHRLVQAVTRDQLGDDQAAEWAERALNMAEAVLPPSPADYRSWPTYARLAPHIEAAIAHVHSFPILADKIEPLRNLGVYLSESGRLGAARTMFQRALVIDEAVSGPDDVEATKDLDNLAAVQLKLGELRDARVTIERSLQIFEAVYGPDHPEVGRSLHNLGVAKMRLGELRDARADVERAVAILEEARVVEPSELATALDNLAMIQLQLRKLRDARASAERAVAIREAALGPDHPAVARSLGILVAIQRRQLKFIRAGANANRAIDIAKTTTEPDIWTLLQISRRSLRGRISSYVISKVISIGPDSEG